ncbi:unnamed protein product [Arctia plantaginis]|uniref:Smr domain-containing protein n=1 Tax=Arctia plantaginis TaxID=874455 RepID=A0A8S1B6V5_ARCPL|nr:unnamed protein product [Arctia plantaginis]
MEPQRDEDSDFNIIVMDRLVDMVLFCLSKIVITALVSSFGGNGQLCVDQIPKRTNDGTITSTKDHRDSISQSTQPQCISQNRVTSISHERTTQSTNVVPKDITQRTVAPSRYFLTDQIRNIISHNKNGSRIMIIMRGLPGSGKSHLARLIVETLIGPSLSSYNSHVFSSDHYFMVRGKYQYDKSHISNAHSWNLNRVKESAIQGLSPIIIDNTNIDIWEMRPYVEEALKNGYIIEVVEPMTPWAKIPRQLFNMNIHRVPLQKIERMFKNYAENITSEILLHALGINYSKNMVPPVLRSIPVIPPIPAENKSYLISYSEATSFLENVQNEARDHLLQSSKQSYQNSHEQQKDVEDSGQDRIYEISALNIFHEEICGENISVDMSTVQQYRDDTEKHLVLKNRHMQKAAVHKQRGMTKEADLCLEKANFFEKRYELARNEAVASLIQYHAAANINSVTVNLHFYRVKEAIEVIDVFLDGHIRRLRDLNIRNVMLFFITGRGLHSPGPPKVKLACMERLRERGL